MEPEAGTVPSKQMLTQKLWGVLENPHCSPQMWTHVRGGSHQPGLLPQDPGFPSEDSLQQPAWKLAWLLGGSRLCPEAASSPDNLHLST